MGINNRPTAPQAPTWFDYLHAEMRAVVASLDTMPANEIRSLGALFLDAARARERQQGGV